MDILAQIVEEDHVADDSIPAGFLFASIKNIGNNSTTVNGVALAPGEAKAYPFVGKAYQALPFLANGSTLRILYVI